MNNQHDRLSPRCGSTPKFRVERTDDQIGSSRYVLNARNGQNLYVRVAPQGGPITYQILNPDRSFLLDQTSSDREYRGQLWQSGDHVIEVTNRTNGSARYSVIMGID